MIYELHIGTFTTAGTFDAAIEKLDYLVDLGIDFVELMPVNSFAGTRGWGYDGAVVQRARTLRRPRRSGPVHRRMPCPSFGRVDRRGVQPSRPIGQLPAAIRPVPVVGQQPVGDGINIAGADSDEVRHYIIDCALRWMRDFHADGLRLDAVHALVDTTAVHVLEELANATRWLSGQLGRPLSLIAETDRNDPRLITRPSHGGYGITAQWNDDIHHAIHTAVSGERQGYYADFGSLATLAYTLRNGYFHAGTYSSFRRRRHGRALDTSAIPATRLLAYTCTHDQVGNRALGDRPSQYLTGGQLAIKAALTLDLPIPQCFSWAKSGGLQPVSVLLLTSRTGTGP